MSQRQLTSANYSLCYIDLDRSGDNPILTEEADVITMRIQNTPGSYISLPVGKSVICDIKIEGR